MFMKYSDYNTILPLSEKLGLVYCGSTDQFVIYKRALTPLLESISADQLAIEAPSLYAELVRGGGIVNDEENEFVKLKRLADEVECSPKTYRLILNYCCPLKVSEQRDIHPQCCCNGIADDFSEGKPLS